MLGDLEKNMKIKEINYGQLKQNTRRLFGDLMGYIDSITRKDDDCLQKLKEILTELGIEIEITKEKKFNIIIKKSQNFFEKTLLEEFDCRRCSICGKLGICPIRDVSRDCHHHHSTYGESIPHHYEPICENCFTPILNQWKEQVKGMRERWVKEVYPNWKKTETGYIDEFGNKYPL